MKVYSICFSVLISLTSASLLTDELSLPKGILQLDGKPAPEVTLPDLDQEIYRLSDSRGRWVFLHFWASWCGPCRREMPTIQQAVDLLGNKSGMDFILINTAEDEDTIFTFMGIVAPDLRTLMDSDGLVTEKWQPRGLPATFFISPEGKLRYLALGGRPWDKTEYQAFLKKLTTAGYPH